MGGTLSSRSCPRCSGYYEESIEWEMLSLSELFFSYKAWCKACEFEVNYENEAWFPSPDKDFKEVTSPKLIPLFLPGDRVIHCDGLSCPRYGVVVNAFKYCSPDHVGVRFDDDKGHWHPVAVKDLVL